MKLLMCSEKRDEENQKRIDYSSRQDCHVRLECSCSCCSNKFHFLNGTLLHSSTCNVQGRYSCPQHYNTRRKENCLPALSLFLVEYSQLIRKLIFKFNGTCKVACTRVVLVWFPLCGFIQGLVLVDQVWVRKHSDSTRQKPPSCSNSVLIVKINKYINGGYPRNVQIFLVSTIYHLVKWRIKILTVFV